MNLRKAAKGKMCTLSFPGCNFNPETSVLAHVRNMGFGEGMGKKPDDRAAVIACNSCHNILDRRAKDWEQFEADRWFYIARALVRTRIQQEQEVEDG